MKKLILAFVSAFLILNTKAQTFTGTGGAITNNGVPTYFTLNTGTLPSSLNNSFGLVEVCFEINHAEVNELNIALLSPTGIYVELVNNTGVKGGNFISTCINAGAGSPLTLATAPYTGTYSATGYIGRFNANVSGNGNWSLVVKDYLPNGNSGNLISWKISFGNNPPQSVNFTSSNLPLVFISTGGQSISTNTILADLGIVDNVTYRNSLGDARNGYNGKTKLNIRGSSSQIFEKKALKLDLCNANGSLPVKAPILGMPVESDWVLTPGYSDKSLLRNALSQHAFRSMGHYSPRTRFVELFINNEYYGVYTFMEKIKQGDDRVPVDNMTDFDNNFPFITGGYIIQVNRTDDDGWYSLYPGISLSANPPKFYYQYVHPRAEEITVAQKNYIKAYMDTIETVMAGPNFADPNTGYRKYLNVESFVDLMILNEFSKNVDGYKLSTYLYKDNVIAGGKLHAGPAWDYDIAWKNANYANGDAVQWWQYDQPDNNTPMPTWWKRMMQDPYFSNLLYCRWHTLRLSALSTSNLNAYVDQNKNTLMEAQARNFTQFPILNQYVFPNPGSEINTDYSKIVDDLKSWINTRGAWLDQNVPGYCNNVGISETTVQNHEMSAYPNPFDGQIHIEYYSERPGERLIEICSALGETIYSAHPLSVEAGKSVENIDLGHLQNGTYLLRLQVNGQTYHKKIMRAGN